LLDPSTGLPGGWHWAIWRLGPRGASVLVQDVGSLVRTSVRLPQNHASGYNILHYFPFLAIKRGWILKGFLADTQKQ
jgi:hypothetical protein